MITDPTRLQTAMQRGEFTLQYQPVVDSLTQRAVSVEAFVRWNDPAQGLRGPGTFLRVAEGSALILPLGAFVLQAACRQMQQWRVQWQAACPARVTVNVSYRQCLDPFFVGVVGRALREAGMPPDALELELTRTKALCTRPDAVDTIRGLRRLGVRLAMDDVGPDLSAIRQFVAVGHVKTLKIDASVVRRLPAQSDLVGIDSIYWWGARHGADVVAEGVETRDQLAILLKYARIGLQGYLFARPMAPEDLDFGTLYHVGPAEESSEGIPLRLGVKGTRG